MYQYWLATRKAFAEASLGSIAMDASRVSGTEVMTMVACNSSDKVCAWLPPQDRKFSQKRFRYWRVCFAFSTYEGVFVVSVLEGVFGSFRYWWACFVEKLIGFRYWRECLGVFGAGEQFLRFRYWRACGSFSVLEGVLFSFLSAPFYILWEPIFHC